MKLLLATILIALEALAPPALPDDVRENVVRRVDDRFSASIVVGLVNDNGSSFFAHGTTALSGGVEPDENTVYEIGSITKVFTGTLLADMVGRGTLELDDPVEAYLPDEVAFPGAIRLVDLATHRSGLPRMPDNVDPAVPLNPFADYGVDDLYAFLSSWEPSREADEAYEYSNVGAGLLGHVLERATGESFELLVSERITGPLGMDSTGITLSESMQQRFARPHAMTIEVLPWDIPTMAGAGALRSTASDMISFLAAAMDPPDTPLGAALALALQPRAAADRPALSVGLLWHTLGEGDRAVVWHNGQTGGFHAFAGFRADGSLGVVVLANSADSIDDVGLHLLDPSFPLAVKKKPRRVPLFAD